MNLLCSDDKALKLIHANNDLDGSSPGVSATNAILGLTPLPHELVYLSVSMRREMSL